MILHQKRVDQPIDRDERSSFIKELVIVRFVSGGDEIPLCMVRKRCAKALGELGTVLLVHGYGQNRYAWHLPSRSFSNYLARAGFDVFNLDLRGHGRSRHLGARRPSHVTDYVREDLPAAIDEVQRLSRGTGVFLVGHSLGGLISYATATTRPKDIRGIVTLGSPYLFTHGSWALRLLGSVMLGIDRRVPLGHGALALKSWGELVRLARVLIESPIFPLPIRGFVPGSIEPNVLAQHMSLAMDAGSITVLRNMFLSAAESRASKDRLGGLTGYANAFEQLDLPLLIIAGSKDDLAPPLSVVPAYERSRAREKSYRLFPRGHIDLVVGREAPLTVWPLIEAWLRARLRERAS